MAESYFAHIHKRTLPAGASRTRLESLNRRTCGSGAPLQDSSCTRSAVIPAVSGIPLLLRQRQSRAAYPRDDGHTAAPYAWPPHPGPRPPHSAPSIPTASSRAAKRGRKRRREQSEPATRDSGSEPGRIGAKASLAERSGVLTNRKNRQAPAPLQTGGNVGSSCWFAISTNALPRWPPSGAGT